MSNSRNRIQPFTTIKSLVATTAMPTAILPMALLGTGLVVGSTVDALADDPATIPVEYLRNSDGNTDRLGIWAAINNGKAQRYIFDTGSDQLNTQIGPEVTGVQPVTGRAPYVYTYGDGTYGYKLQTVEFDKLTYSDPNDPSKTIIIPTQGNEKYKVGKITDFIYSEGYSDFDKINHDKDPIDSGLKDIYGEVLQDKYYADLDQRELIRKGEMAEEGGNFAGTFGAGDYLFNSSSWSLFGGATKSGYIVSANAGTERNETPGCSPCAIVNLNPNLRAQFTNIMPWQEPNAKDPHGEYFRPTFPGSGANASTLYEGNYDLQLTAVDGQNPIPEKAAALLDTGTPGGGSATLSDDLFAKIETSGVKLNDVKKDKDGNITSATGTISSLTIAGPDGDPIPLENIDFVYSKGTDKTTVTTGLDFFLNRSVVFDLEKQSTAYTPYFVSADNFTTDTPAAGETGLTRVTTRTGNEGWFGVAGVISGTGALTLDPKTNVRMTNANTYTGATYISHDAYLSLAGLGGIERSAEVAADGTLDISEHGNGDAYWGIPDSENDARIRSLSGGSTGVVELGDRTLVLTAANDAFAGNINDLDVDNKNMGGGLHVAGGVQALSGRNDYSGMTTVDSGAGLLLAETGSITHDVTTSGLLGNDGQIGDLAQADRDGAIVGTGSFGAVTIADGGKVAPGSAFDSGLPITALTVEGNFTQQAGSIYEAGLSKSSDLISIGGSAAIDGGAQIELVRQGTASVDTRYTLLTAAGGVNGTFGGLTGTLVTDSPFVDFELAYDPQNVFLDTERTATAFADVAGSFNQRSVAPDAEALGAGNAIHDGVLFLTTRESRDAFDQLSGEVHASVHSALIEDSHFVGDAASDRIHAAFDGVGASAVPVMSYGPGGPEIAPANGDRLAVWGRGFGAWGHLDADGNAARLDRSTGGFLAGADTLVGQDWRLGLLAGYSHTSFEVDGRLSSGSSENYHLGAYAGTQWGKLGFRSGLAYTWHRLDTDRSVAFPGFSDSLSSEHDAGTFQAFGELGYRIDTPMAAFEPYGNLAYVHLKTDGFREEGGAAALNGWGETSDTTFTTLGLRASADLQLGAVPATARGGIGWRHAFGDVTPEATLAFAGGDAFAVRGTPIAKDTALVEAGLDVNVTRNASIGLAYQGQLASSAQEHGFNAKLDVRF